MDLKELARPLDFLQTTPGIGDVFQELAMLNLREFKEEIRGISFKLLTFGLPIGLSMIYLYIGY